MAMEGQRSATAAVIQRVAAGLSKGCAYAVALADANLVIEWISPSIEHISGWRPEQLIGTSALELIHPDDLDGVVRLLDDEAQMSHPYIGGDPGARAINPLRIRNASGAWQAVDVAVNNQLDAGDVGGIVVVLRDVSERRLLDDVYDSFLAGLPIESTADRIAKLLSWQLADGLVRIELDDGLTATAGTSVQSAVEIVMPVAGTTTRIVAQHPRAGEPSEWIHILLERAAGLLRLAVVRHLGEQQLRRSLDEKAAIISAVSHDLSSPIAAISIMSTLLDGSNDALSDDQRRHLAQRISTDAQRTSRLLADLTFADRLLRGAMPFSDHCTDIATLVQRVLAEAEADGHELVAGSFAAGLSASADPVLTERILANLITNAMKYTPRGSKIVVSATLLGADEVLLTVDDDGPGVPESVRGAVFDAYSRPGDSSAGPGSGLGLYLVRTFAEVQGGRAWCEQSPLGGARFAVALPRCCPKD